MFTAALLNNGQHMETTWMSSNRWTDEDVVYYTQWNISSKKKNLLWFQHIAWMVLELIMLSEKSQKEK